VLAIHPNSVINQFKFNNTGMAKFAFFSTRPYDRQFFESVKTEHTFEFFETRLRPQTVNLAHGFDGVCVFVNDRINEETLELLSKADVRLVALRSAGFNNVDLKAAKNTISAS
jgi:D-lactate dehydrogenase